MQAKNKLEVRKIIMAIFAAKARHYTERVLLTNFDFYPVIAITLATTGVVLQWEKEILQKKVCKIIMILLTAEHELKQGEEACITQLT